MSKSILFDNGNGGLGLQVVTDDAGLPFAIGIFTRTHSGADRVLTGTLVDGSQDSDGGTFSLSRGLGYDYGDGNAQWPQPAATRAPCGHANLTRLPGGGWNLVMLEVDLNAGELQPSPPAPSINITLQMHPLTA